MAENSVLQAHQSPFYIVLEKEVKSNLWANRHVTYADTIFLFVLSLYTKMVYFINSKLKGKKGHVIEDVEKGKVEALKKYCEVVLVAWHSFNREAKELVKCIYQLRDRFTSNEQTSFWAKMQLYTWLYFTSGQYLPCMLYAVDLLRKDVVTMITLMESKLINPLELLNTDETLDKISQNRNEVQKWAMNTIEMVIKQMETDLLQSTGNYLQKSSCLNDYMHHREPGVPFVLSTNSLPKVWMCTKCWQWNKNELLYANTQSAACEHCNEPVIPDTIGKFNNHNKIIIQANSDVCAPLVMLIS